MRPITRWGLLAIVSVCLVGAGVWAAVAQRCAATTAKKTIARIASELMVATAHAQNMKFEPLPPESASSFDRARTRRRTSTTSSRSTTPSAPATPAPPATPDAPDAPEPPTPPVTIGKTGDIMRVGSDVVVGPDEVVTGDALAVGGDLRVEGHVEGNAVSLGGDIYLEPTARVDGDVVCMGGELHEETGAVVGGKRVVGPGGKRGRLGRVLRGRDFDVDNDHERTPGADIGGALAWLLVWLLVGWATVKITPSRTGEALQSFSRSPGAAFLSGWLALALTIPGLIAVCLLTALLCITIIGIPLGIAVLFAYFLLLGMFVIWGGVVGAGIVGERLAMRQGHAAPTVQRAVITGVLAMGGALLVVRILKAMHFVPLFHGLGMFLGVIFIIFNILVGVTGWGAVLRSEFTSGFIARWWHGRRGGDAGRAPAAPAGPAGPAGPTGPAGPGGTSVTTVTTPVVATPPETSFAPATPPPPPPPPSSPEAFMPPRENPPPSPTG